MVFGGNGRKSQVGYERRRNNFAGQSFLVNKGAGKFGELRFTGQSRLHPINAAVIGVKCALNVVS